MAEKLGETPQPRRRQVLPGPPERRPVTFVLLPGMKRLRPLLRRARQKERRLSRLLPTAGGHAKKVRPALTQAVLLAAPADLRQVVGLPPFVVRQATRKQVAAPKRGPAACRLVAVPRQVTRRIAARLVVVAVA